MIQPPYQRSASSVLSAYRVPAKSFLDSTDTVGLKKPVFVGCAGTDVFTPHLITDMLSQLPNSGSMYKLAVYGGTKHGFASRVNQEDKTEAIMYQQALEDGLSWMKTASANRVPN